MQYQKIIMITTSEQHHFIRAHGRESLMISCKGKSKWFPCSRRGREGNEHSKYTSGH